MPLNNTKKEAAPNSPTKRKRKYRFWKRSCPSRFPPKNWNNSSKPPSRKPAPPAKKTWARSSKPCRQKLQDARMGRRLVGWLENYCRSPSERFRAAEKSLPSQLLTASFAFTRENFFHSRHIHLVFLAPRALFEKNQISRREKGNAYVIGVEITQIRP